MNRRAREALAEASVVRHCGGGGGGRGEEGGGGWNWKGKGGEGKGGELWSEKRGKE